MSNTIDERVVVLKFDNKEFETNAQKSLDTLDRLDKSLQLGNASKSLSGIAISSKSLGLSGLGESVDMISKRFSTLGIIGMTALQEITKTAMRTGHSLVNRIINPIIEGGKRRAANIEQADFMLHGLIDDEAQIAEIGEAAQKSVDKTAFSLDAATKAAAQFTAAGVETGEQLNTVLSAVAGTAATFNTDYQGIANIFTKIASQGRVQGDEFNQLTERGVPATDVMVKYINEVNKGTIEASESIKTYVQELTGGMEISGDAIVDFRKRGLLTFELFSAAMSQSFGNNAQKANDTVTGVLANINSAFARTGAAFIAPLIKSKGPLVQFLESIRLQINAFNKAMAPFAEAVTQAINERILPAAQKLVESLPISKISGFFNLAAGWVRTVFKLGKSVQEAAEKPKKAMEELNEAVKKISPKEAAAAWDIWNKGLFGNGEERKRLLKEAGLSYENVQGYVNELIKADFDLSKVETKVGEATSDASKKAAAAKAKVNDVIEKQKKELSPAVKLWFSFRSTISGIADIGKAIGNAFKKIRSNFKMTVKPTEGLVDKLFEATWRFKAFTSSLQLSDKAAKGIATVLQFLGNAISTVASFAGKATLILGGGFIKLVEMAGGAIYSFFGKVSTNVNEQGGLAGIIGKLRDRFVEFITAVGNSEGFKKFTTEARNFGTFVKDKFLGAMEKLNGLFSTFAGFIMKAAGAKNFTDLISKAFGNLGTLIEKLRGGKEAIKEFFNAAKKKIDLGKIFSFGGGDKNDSEGPLSKLASIKDKFVDTIRGIFVNDKTITITTKIKDFFKRIGDILGEVDWNKLIATGMSMVKLYSAFRLIRSFDKLASGISGALGAVTGLAKAAKNKIRMETLKAFATSVLILTGAIFVLSTIPADKLPTAIKAMVFALGSMLGAVAILDKINAGAAKMSAIGLAFAGLGAAILMISLAAHQIVALTDDELKRAGTVILALIGVLTIAAKFAGGLGGLGFASMALAIYLIAPAMQTLADIDFETVKASAKNLALIMGVLAVAARIAGGAASGAIKMLALALAVDLMIPAILILSSMNFKQALQGAGFLSLIMVALGGAVRLAGGSAGKAASLVAMALAAVAAAAVVIVLGTLPWQMVLQGVLAIAAVMFSIAGAAKLASSATTGALAIGAVLTLITIAFYVLLSTNPEMVLPVAAGMALAVLAIAGAIVILEKTSWLGGVKAAWNLMSFIVVMGAVLIGIGALFDKFENLDKLLDKGLGVLRKLVTGLAGIIAEAGTKLTSGLPEMGDNFAKFAEGFEKFVYSFQGFNPKALMDLGDALFRLSENTYTSGNLTNIANELNGFAEPMGAFIERVRGTTEEDVRAVGFAIGAAQAAAERAQGIKDIGKLSEVGEGLTVFGTEFVKYSYLMAKVKTDAVTGATAALRQTAGVIKTVNQNGGDSAALEAFGLNINNFATDFSNFSSKAASVNPEGVTKLIASAKQLQSFAKSVSNTNTSSLGNFADSMKSFVSGFSGAMNSASNMKSGGLSGMQNTMSSLTGIIKAANTVNPGDFSKFVQSFNKAGSQGVDGFIKAFTGATGRVQNAAAGVANAAASGINAASYNGISTAYSVGASIGDGLIRGISAKLAAIRAAYNEAGRLAAATTAIGAKVNSPSKISMKTGEAIGEGIIVGYHKISGRVYKSGSLMGEKAATSVSSALKKVRDIVNSGIEDDLVITPVLDLSEVQSGAAGLGNLLGNSTFDLLGRANVVGNVVSTSRQETASNADVVQAIKGLQNRIDNIQPNVTNVNGITYDDGSNVTDAVRQLIRAARVERRA